MPETVDATPRRWRRRLLIGGVLLALLIGGGAVALLRGFSPERVAALVADQVRTRTGRDFAIRGPLSYQLLPRIAVVAEGLALGNAPWGSRKDMLRVERAAFELELWPLLWGRAQVGSVELEGVDLLLETDRQGVGNWVLSAPQPAREPTALPAPASAPPAGDKNLSPQAFELDTLRLRRVAIAYRSGGTTQQLALDSLDLDRTAAGNRVAAEWVVQGQRWRASGQLASLAALIENRAEWPFELAFTSEGARIGVEGHVGPGAASRGARLELDATIDKAAALTPWMSDAAGVPLPVELKSTLDIAPKSVRANPLQVSLAGQTLAGRATLSEGDPWQLEAELRGGRVDLTRVWPDRGAGGGAAVGGGSGDRRALFGDDKLPIDALPDARARVTLRIDQLLLPAAPPLSAVTANIDLKPGTLKAEPLAFAIAGGQVRGGVTLDTHTNAPPRVNLRIDASGLSAETLARAAGASDKLGGGRLDLKTTLAMTGATPRALAAGASGDVLLSIKDMTLADGALSIGPNLLPRLLQILQPQRGAAKVTHVECAVARLPLRNGVATVDRSIAAETAELTFSASGKIDLRDQTLALAIRPDTRKVLGVNPAQLASLVVAKGPLLDPKLTLDTKGAAQAALSIGAAAATGGWSLLGKNLLNQTGDPHPCAYAATGVAAKAPSTSAAPAPKPDGKAPAGKPDEVQKLLRKLFK
jgi:uncharacterized protein involved in outer membrane biogenesis